MIQEIHADQFVLLNQNVPGEKHRPNQSITSVLFYPHGVSSKYIAAQYGNENGYRDRCKQYRCQGERYN